MRICFILIGNSRRSNYLDGETLRYGGAGGSGTDTSTILIAEYLASQGNEVVVTMDKLEPQLEQDYKEMGRSFELGKKVRGVYYTDIEFTNIENKEFDVLINSLWFTEYDKLPIKVTKALIYWCHMQWVYGIGEMIEFAKNHNLALGYVNISNWEKEMTQNIVNTAISNYNNVKTTLIPNPICDDVLEKVKSENISKKPHKFIFHASWPRGGSVSFEAVDKLELPEKEFHAFDYLMVIHNHDRPYFHIHMGVDKITLFRHLAESEYFIYPLYTPYQDVHKDTFSCVVAEAIALGVTPVTYSLGALPDNFEGYCHWLDFPEGVERDNMQKEPLSKDLEGKFKCTDNIVKAIEWLEKNPEIKNHIKENGENYIVKKFNVKTVGNMWVEFIASLMN
jgi:glycosyltransferase involved in cell wall biosynthesis